MDNFHILTLATKSDGYYNALVAYFNYFYYSKD